MFRSKLLTVILVFFALVSLLRFGVSLYFTGLFFDIEKYIIEKEFKGDVQRHQEALNAGSIKYCDNYVFLHGGIPASTLQYTKYYRVSDGVLYSEFGTEQICTATFKWDVFLLGRNIFSKSKYETPLTCSTPKDLHCSENCPGLQCAVRYNEVSSVNRLIAQGQDPNSLIWGAGQVSILMYAVYQRNYDIAEILIENGADVNFHDKEGRTALYELTVSVPPDQMFPELFRLLIESGTEINATDNGGQTPLFWLLNRIDGFRSDGISELKMFLENGADPNIQDINGDTAFVFYLHRLLPKKETVRVLLNFHADPFIINNEGKSAYDIAKERALEDIVQLFEEN